MARKKQAPYERLPSDDPDWKPTTWDEVIAGFDPACRATMEKWRARGDGVAVYRNEDFSSGNVGHVRAMSIGSEASNWPDSRWSLPATWPFACATQWAYKLLAEVRA